MEKTKREKLIDAAADYILDNGLKIVKGSWTTEAKQGGRNFLGEDIAKFGRCYSELCFKMTVGENLDENMRQTTEFLKLFGDIHERTQQKAIDSSRNFE